MLELFELGADDCRRLLAGGVVGRVAVTTPEGPHVVPVNYVLLDEAVTFHTGRDGAVATHAPGTMVAFAVDQVDYQWQHGWTVLVRGVCELVTDDRDVEWARRTAPSPWAAGSRELVLRVPCSQVTGRQLGHGWDPVADMPVHRVMPVPDRPG